MLSPMSFGDQQSPHNDSNGHLIDKHSMPPPSADMWLSGYDNPVLDDFELHHAAFTNGTYNVLSAPPNSQ